MSTKVVDKFMVRTFINDSNVRQQVGNEFLCLTDLQNAYNLLRLTDSSLPEKRIVDYFIIDNEMRMLSSLLVENDVIDKNMLNQVYEEMKINGCIKTLKKYNVYKTTGRGDNKIVICDPYIFVSVAMWINPDFKAKCIKWIGDQLIIQRIECGERFITLTDAISQYIVPKLESDTAKKFIYSNCAKLLNKKIFNKHDDDLRQLATKDQLKQLRDLQVKVATLIEVGYLNTYDDIKKYLSL
jgi:hypothetical protein